MATISQTNATTWQGVFNDKRFYIMTRSHGMEVATLDASGVKHFVTGHELTSLMRFYRWHLATKQQASELPALYTLSSAREEV